jgi:hypothetical protein
LVPTGVNLGVIDSFLFFPSFLLPVVTRMMTMMTMIILLQDGVAALVCLLVSVSWLLRQLR